MVIGVGDFYLNESVEAHNVYTATLGIYLSQLVLCLGLVALLHKSFCSSSKSEAVPSLFVEWSTCVTGDEPRSGRFLQGVRPRTCVARFARVLGLAHFRGSLRSLLAQRKGEFYAVSSRFRHRWVGGGVESVKKLDPRSLEVDHAFSSVDAVAQCLLDRKRTEAFRKAITRAVKPGDLVLDAGTGSGILAMFAAQAGAERVIALERDPYLARPRSA